MERVTEIVYGKTDEIVETYPTEWALGAPSNPSASVYLPDGSNDDSAEFSPTVTVDTVSTTVDQVSGDGQSNPRRIYLAATTSITVGRRYLVTNADGQRESVTVTKIASGDHVDVETDLAYSYGVGATFVGYRMTFPVNTTWVSTESKITPHGVGPYRVLWVYTLGGTTRRHYTYLRLVRQRAGHTVTLADLAAYVPDLAHEEPRSKRGQQFAWAIDAAWGDVRVDFVARDIPPDRLRDLEVVNRLVVAKAVYNLATVGLGIPADIDPESHIARFADKYQSLLLSLVDAGKVPADVGQEGGASSGPAITTLWFSR